MTVTADVLPIAVAASTPPTTPTADFWFDPICPWAWMTSRWMGEVGKVREIRVRWHIFSLSVLNEGRELPPGYRARMDRAWGPARVVNAAAIEHGDAVIKPLYDALGTRFHPGGRGGDDERDAVLAEALAELGLPADLARYANADTYDAQLRASTADALALVGDDVGVPIVAFNGTAFFGPVVTPAPKGEAAGKLWDGCLAVAQTPGFFELKRTRTQAPMFD